MASKLISEIVPGDLVMTRGGPAKVTKLLRHEYKGPMLHMSGGELVTPGHHLWIGDPTPYPDAPCLGRQAVGEGKFIWKPGHGRWVPARELFTETRQFEGAIFNLEIEGLPSEAPGAQEGAHEYMLENGWVAHNAFKQ